MKFVLAQAGEVLCLLIPYRVRAHNAVPRPVAANAGMGKGTNNNTPPATWSICSSVKVIGIIVLPWR
jgi:hypothetical protein